MRCLPRIFPPCSTLLLAGTLELLLLSSVQLCHAFCGPGTTGRRASASWRLAATSRQRESSVEDALHYYGYATRLVKISSDQLPLLAEAYLDGDVVFGWIESFQVRDGGTKKEPRIAFRPASDGQESTMIDMGQLTTIWEDSSNAGRSVSPEAKKKRPFSMKAVEVALDGLYNSRVRRSRSAKKGLTKKEIADVASQISGNDNRRRAHVEEILRKVVKTGSGFARLIDSDALRLELVARDRRQRPVSSSSICEQRRFAAESLVQDARLGGRFKRWPCVHVANGHETDVSLLNGGWLVADQSVRATTEGRKFTERQAQNQDDSSGRNGKLTSTVADDRIIQRLECLAMGEIFNPSQEEDLRGRHSDRMEIDVREVLKTMGLPLTPKGAQQALLRIGLWSGSEDFSRIEPWSRSVLESAAWFVERGQGTSSEDRRVDLRKLPCISIDSEQTSFRDDAVGLRPRAQTGRWTDPNASRWEILVHITDASDLYGAKGTNDVYSEKDHLAILKGAAQKRGTSRYDLPLGPLHLLPPRVLNTLSFSTKKKKGLNCVTVWAFIDERDGNLLDCGVERTITAPVAQLSFFEATRLMASSPPAESGAAQAVAKLRAALLILERNLGRWSMSNQMKSSVAQQREHRLRARERRAEIDEDFNGFQRSRSHRLVDAALDLYGTALTSLMADVGAPIPRAAGADASRGGRVATAPLRRYVDGEAQRQALAVLCDQGKPLTEAECRKVAKLATDAVNSISNVRAARFR